MNKRKDNYIFYNFITFLARLVGHIYFRDKVIGKENIPKQGKCILAGNHVSNFDVYFLFRGCKRPIHFLGKIELFKGKFSWLFKWMHVIPVDRNKKNPEAREKAIEVLNEEKVIGIFPEGTFHKETLILPFKPGVINFAEKTCAPIIPFVIKGKIKFWGKPTIIYGKPIYIKDINEKDKIKYLENVIIDMLTK